MTRVFWSDLGVEDYQAAYALQQGLRERVRQEDWAGVMLILEHPPTITLGYSLKGDEGRTELKTDKQALEGRGISVIQVDRGGKATYHGPGQVVGYPVLHIRRLGLGTKRYVSKLENFLIQALARLGLEAERDSRYPGVWVQDAKVAALGVHISEKITTHGFALNLEPDLEHFKHIVPCGIADRGVTSIREILGEAPDRELVIQTLVQAFGEEFNTEMIKIEQKMVRGLSFEV